MKTRPYHHGDTRAALVAAGLKLLERRSVDDVSLREVARTAGVSATAVYRHFEDKGALLEAISLAGFEMLARAQRVAAVGCRDVASGFNATGYAYVRFALDNPALFRLMFSSAKAIDMRTSEDHDSAFALLRENARKITGADEQTAADFATRAWAMVHGLAILLLDQQLTLDDAGIARVVDAAALFGG